jgi:hypothetical protein
MTPSSGLGVETALAGAEQAARAGEELLQRGAEVSESWEVAEVFCSASRCHHVLLARLSRYDHDISTD